MSYAFRAAIWFGTYFLLIITPLVTFMVMNRIGLSANLMSLGGLAIAIGLMVDGTVVVVPRRVAAT